MGTHESLDHSAISDNHSTSCEAEHNIAISKMLQAMKNNVHNIVGFIHYKTLTDRESQIVEHVRQKLDATTQLKKHWSEEVAISEHILRL